MKRDNVDMKLKDDTRAVAPVIGFILIFGFLVIAFIGYQAEIVPQQNQGVEFEHNQDVQSDLQDLHTSLLDIRTINDNQGIREHRAVRVRLGTQYPTRLIALNPPPSQGLLSSQNEGTISIDNAEVDNSAFTGNSNEANQIMLEEDHTTQLLVYEPRYSEYQNPPTTVFEHSLLYNQFDDVSLAIADQRLIREGTNTINIVLFEGDVSKSGLQTTIDPETLDGPTAQVPIKPINGNTYEITLPTRSPEIWTDKNVINTSSSGIESVTQTGQNEVTIEINDNESWNLQMTKVGYDGGKKSDKFSSIMPDSLDPGVESSTYDVSSTTDEIRVEPGDEIDQNDWEVRVTSRESGDPIEGATVDIGTTNADLFENDFPIDTTDTDSNGAPEFVVEVADDAENGEEAELFAAAGDDVDQVTVIVEEDEEESTPFGVFIQAENDFPQNGEVDSTFDITDGNTEYTFDISVSRRGNSNNYDGSITINGEELTTTDIVASEFGNEQEIDLLDLTIYDGLDDGQQQLINDISNDIDDQEWNVENMNDDGDVGLEPVAIREQE